MVYIELLVCMVLYLEHNIGQVPAGIVYNQMFDKVKQGEGIGKGTRGNLCILRRLGLKF